MIVKIDIRNFTIFENVSFEFSKGINVFVGENGTGKTHLIKALYAASTTINPKEQKGFGQKLSDVFYPTDKHIGRLVHRAVGRNSASLKVYTQYEENDGHMEHISLSITTLMKKGIDSECKTSRKWANDADFQSVFIPVKDMMANAPGFIALYTNNKIHFEDIYVDILNKAYLPTIRGAIDPQRKKLLSILQKAISGNVTEKNGEFYLTSKGKNLEFTLLAEGHRKLGLLWTLIQNGVLTKGSVLFWDEPESNINPKLTKVVIEILLELQRMGVQIFLTTHNYVLLKEIGMGANSMDKIKYFSLYKENDGVKYTATEHYDEIEHNPIAEAYDDLLGREISKTLGGML